MQSLFTAYQLPRQFYYRHAQGLDMQFKWSWSIIGFSLITIIECPSESFLESISATSRGRKRGSEAGSDLQSQSWALPLAHALLLVPMGTSGIQLCFQGCAGSRACAAISTYSHRLHPYGCETLEDRQIHSLPCHQHQRHAQQPASPLAPSAVNHASLEPDPPGEITL